MIQVMSKAETEEGSGGAVKPSEVRPAITQQKLRALIRSKLKCDEDIGELAGSIGGEIKAAVDKNHLDKKMFGWIVQLSRMTDEKMAEHLENLEHYLDISGLNERAEKVQRLDLGDQSKAGEEETEPKSGRAGRTVKPFPKPTGEQKD